MALTLIPEPETIQERLEALFAGGTIATCEVTGARLSATRHQYLLTYHPPGGSYEVRHWYRRQVSKEDILARAQASLDRLVAIYGLQTAVWEGEVDQKSTRELAEAYGLSLSQTRKALLDIVNADADERFQKAPDRTTGVLIRDGRVFDYSPMDLDGGGGMGSDRKPKHFIWFIS